MNNFKQAFSFRKRKFDNKYIIFSCFLGVFVILSEHLYLFFRTLVFGIDIYVNTSIREVIADCMRYSVFPFLFPLLCTFISQNNVYNSKYVRFEYARLSISDYLFKKIIPIGLLTGLMLSLIIIFSAIIIALVCSLNSTPIILFRGTGYVWSVITAYFFGGITISLISLLFSELVEDKWLTLFAPCVIYIFLIYLTSYYGSKFTPLDLLMTYNKSVNIFESTIIFLMINVTTLYVMIYYFKRKKEN